MSTEQLKGLPLLPEKTEVAEHRGESQEEHERRRQIRVRVRAELPAKADMKVQK